MNEILVPATQPETSTDGNARKQKKRDTNGAGSDPVAASESPQNATIPERPRASRVPLLEKRPDFDHGPSPKSAQQRRRKSRSPQRDEARPARRRPSRQSSSPTAQRDYQTSTKDVQRRGDPNTLEAIQSPVADASASAGRPETESPRPITAVAENDNQTDQRPSSGDETWSKPKRGGPRNAKGKSSQSARDATLQKESEQTQEDETRDEPANTASQASSKQKRGRKRRSPALTTPDPNAEEASAEGEAGPATAESKPQFKSKRPRRESSPVGKKATAEAEARPEKPAGSSAAAGESSAAATRRARKASKKRVAEPQPEVVDPEPEETSQEPEPEVDALPETQAGPSRARRDRTNKGKGKNKRAAEPEEAPLEEQPDTEATQEPRRKTREPRGDTVPVTVHRLANASALGAINVSAEGFGNEDEDSPDGLLSRLNTNIPSRGGVNPADVLSQICRETLEKTLEKLKTGIENETNTQKRAEWTRKRKAVEAFGLELDNRLLDLSEILDSNFVLGMQLRKAKRDMMDLRSHLYKVRKERESIAIQMDAVRAKHMEEENAKTVSTLLFVPYVDYAILHDNTDKDRRLAILSTTRCIASSWLSIAASTVLNRAPKPLPQTLNSCFAPWQTMSAVGRLVRREDC